MTLSPCSRCQAESILLFLPALRSALQSFRSPIFLFNPSWIKRRKGFTKRNPPACSNSTISVGRTRPWNRTKLTARWWFGSETLRTDQTKTTTANGHELTRRRHDESHHSLTRIYADWAWSVRR